jgi:hypothetical protein
MLGDFFLIRVSLPKGYKRIMGDDRQESGDFDVGV